MTQSQNKRIKIIVACHKPDPNVRQDDIYMPIQVGKSLHPELDLGYQCDNTDDNISEKNSSYCELTALYWAWKNLKDVDYVGLCHYRRYLDFKSKGKSVRIIEPEDINTLEDLQPDLSDLSNDEVILPTFWYSRTTIWNSFCEYVIAQDLYILYKVIEKYSPSYLIAFEKYLLGNKRTGYNMFIMSKSNFDKYCEWLFMILSKVEAAVKLHDYISYTRLFGYLGEILLPVYCMANKIKIKEKRVAFCNGQKRKLNTKGRRHIKNFLYKVAYSISNVPKRKTLKNPYWEMYINMDNISI